VGVEELRARCSHMIGIDVVDFVVQADSQARGYGQEPFTPKRLDKGQIQGGEIADVAEPPFHFVVHHGFSEKTTRVRGGNSDGGLAFRGNRSRKFFVQQAGEYHDRCIARFAIRHAQAANEFAFDSHALESGGEKFPAAVHHENFVAFSSQCCNLTSQVAHRGIIFQQRSREFDYRSHSSEVRSSMPSIWFKFWTAWPAAPFLRLSRQDTRTKRRPEESRAKPISQKFVCATCCNSGSVPAGQMRTMGRPA